MLRISRLDQNPGVCLKVEGRLSGDGVGVLEAELAELSRATTPLTLDLAAVDFASLPAVAMLQAATSRGVQVVACSPFLSKLLGPSAL